MKWFEISDERIILVIIYRTFQYYASDSNSNMSFWGSSNNLNAIAQWWFSSTFLSLYLRALVCFIAIKKELFTPLNSKMLLILYLRMCHIATQTSQKSCHYIKIWKMLHYLTRLGKIMIIASNFNNSWDVVVWVLLISCWPNTLQ